MAPSNTPVLQGAKLLDQVRGRIRANRYSIGMQTQYAQKVQYWPRAACPPQAA